MTQMPSNDWTIIEQDQLISQAMERDEPRLRNFIRKHVADTGDAEDILQEVFYELLEAYRLMKPVEHVTAWLFRVARNRMIDLFRKNRPDSLNDPVSSQQRTAILSSSKISCPQLRPVPRLSTPEIYSSKRLRMQSRSCPKRNERSSLPMN